MSTQLQTTQHITPAEEDAVALLPSRGWARVLRAVHEGKVLVITGAGVSAESGIPTFRSVDGSGIYESGDWNPVEFLRSTTVENAIDQLWEYYLERFAKTMEGKEPNPAHLAIAYLETFMRDTDGEFLLVTQNIDGLHLEAGNSPERCIELHGDKTMRCSDECWLRNNGGVAKFSPIPEGAQFPDDLTCPDCGYLMRPHVLLFDEAYSQELYRSTEAHEFATEADVVITVGCSAVVPVAQILTNYAVVNDAVVIDVNPTEESPLITLAEQQGFRFKGRAGIVMPQLVDFLTS
jgi:NAD-dependent deacetylase